MRNKPKAAAPAPLEELPKLDEHLCFALYAAGNHMTRMFVPFLKKLGVTYPQYLVLVVLWERGEMSVPVDELVDLRDRLHRFTVLAGPSPSTTSRVAV